MTTTLVANLDPPKNIGHNYNQICDFHENCLERDRDDGIRADAGKIACMINIIEDI